MLGTIVAIYVNKVVKEHLSILALAFVVGLFTIFPTFISVYKIGVSNFHGIYPTFADDENYYLARTKEVVDGNLSLGSTFRKEHKDLPFIAPPLAEQILGLTARFFRISVPTLFFANDFILPFFGMLILYVLLLNITGLKILSALLSFIFYILYIYNIGRPIHIQFSIIYLFIGLFVFWRIYQNNESEQILTLLNLTFGIIVGALIYIYPYFWTALVVVYGLNFILKMLKNSNNRFTSAKLFFIFSVTAIVMAIPYFLNLLEASKSPFYNDVLLRHGMINTHWPASLWNIVIIFVSFAILFLSREKISKKSELHFALILCLSALILNWQNIITGMYVQFSSHYSSVTTLFVLISLSMVLKNIQIKKEISIIGVLVILAILIIYRSPNGIKKATLNPINFSKKAMNELQEKREVFKWFNENTKKESTVFTFGYSGYESLLPIYTHNNLFRMYYDTLILISDEDLEDRWVVENYFTRDFSSDYIIGNHRQFQGSRFTEKYLNVAVRNKLLKIIPGQEIVETELVPKNYVEKILNKYNNYRNIDFERLIKKFPIDFILLNMRKEDDKKISEKFNNFRSFRLVKAFDDVQIYKVESLNGDFQND